jgi:hypothetical protein
VRPAKCRVHEHNPYWSRNSVVSIVTGRKNSDSISGWDKRFISSPKRPHRPWDTSSLLFGTLFTQGWPRRNHDQLTSSNAEVRNAQRYSSYSVYSFMMHSWINLTSQIVKLSDQFFLSFILSLTSFYLPIVGVKGYCCT